MWLIKTYKRNGTTHAKLTPSAYFLFVSNKNWRFSINLINGGRGEGEVKVKEGVGGISKNSLISVMNGKIYMNV